MAKKATKKLDIKPTPAMFVQKAEPLVGKIVEVEDLVPQNTGKATITKEAPIAPPVKKHQFELSDNDLEFLGSNQYSEDAWLTIGYNRGFDPATREILPNTKNRAYLAVPKKYPPVPMKHTGPLSTTNIQPKVVSASEIRDVMRQRDLTKPTSEEVTEEQI